MRPAVASQNQVSFRRAACGRQSTASAGALGESKAKGGMKSRELYEMLYKIK